MNSPPPVPKKTKTKYPKIFQCTGYGDCKMTFTRSEHLARHIRKHTGERPFRCHCGKTFSRLDNLRQHIQTVHANDHHILHAPLPPPPMPQGELSMGGQPMGVAQQQMQGMPQQQMQQMPQHPQQMQQQHVPSPMMSHHGAPHPHAPYPQMYDYQYPPGQGQGQPPQQQLHHYSSEESLPSSVNSSQTSLQTAYSPQVGANMQRKRRPTPISTEQQQQQQQQAQQQQQQQGPPSPTYPTTPTQYSTHSNHSSIAGISISDMPPVMGGQRPPSLGGDGDAASVFSSPFQSRGHHVRASVSSTNSLTSAYNYPVHSSNLTTPVSTHSNQPGNTNSWLSSVLCSGQDGSASNRHSSASSTSAFSNSPQPDDNRPRTWGPSTNTVAGNASPHQQYRGSGILTGDPGFDSGRQSLSSLVINESMDESDDDMSGHSGGSSGAAPLPPNKDKPLPPFSSLFNAANSANRPQISVNKSYTKNLILPRPDSYPPKPPAAGSTEFGDFSSSHLPMADMRPQPQGQKDKPLPPLPVEADDVEMSDAPQRGGMDYLLEAASLSSRA